MNDELWQVSSDSHQFANYAVTVLHSKYSSRVVSGENIAVQAQSEALADAGAQIREISRTTDSMETSHFYRPLSVLRVATGFNVPSIKLPGVNSRKDILLVHNLFPNFGANIVNQWTGTIVVMVHNYRYLCSNGLFFRNGAQCTDCISGDSRPALRHRCYRDSWSATAPLALATWRAVQRNPVLQAADQIVCQSPRAHALYQEAGIDNSRLSTVVGFASKATVQTQSRSTTDAEGRWLHVGRLTPEKGLADLLHEWPGDQALDVVGDGPLEELANTLGSAGIRFLGHKDHEWVLGNIGRYQGFVFPGQTYEGAVPMVVREAVAHGIPVLAAAGTSASDFVESYRVGLTYTPGAGQLPRALDNLRQYKEQFGRNAAEVSSTLLTRQAWVRNMLHVFDKAMKVREGR